MILSELFVSFILYSFLGWVWETIYCTVREKRFQNRGFLFGPVCPIYGSCIVFVQLMCRFGQGLVDEKAPVWRVFLICAAGSAVAEYLTSWYLEERFHARWWDYSDMPLNVNGRICLPVTLCFGAAGAVIVRLILPWIEEAGHMIPPLAWEAASLLLMGLFAADLALTEAELKALLQKMQNVENEFNRRAEAAYSTLAGTPQQLETGVRALEEEFRGRMRSAAESLSAGQRLILDNIRTFRPARAMRYPLHAGQKLKEAWLEIRSRSAEEDGKEDREEDRYRGDGSDR